MEIELKPCPFCGQKPTATTDKRWPDGADAAVDGHLVLCMNWDCIIYNVDNTWYDTEAEAIAAWNTRHEETCRMAYDSEWMAWCCDSCGVVWLGESYQVPNYCPNCGAKVVQR